MNTIRSLVFGSGLGLALWTAPVAAVATAGCTKEQGAVVITDLAPLEACASNALADALLLGTTDPLLIIGKCAGLTLQVLANIVRDMLASPTQAPSVTDDSGVGFDPRPQMAEAVRSAHLRAVLGNLATQHGVVPQSK